MSDEDAETLKTLINKFVQVTTERRNIGFQMHSFDTSITKLETLKEDAANALSEVENAENEERILSKDIEIIKQEKDRTKTDRKNLEIAHKYMNIFSYVILAGLSISIIVLSCFSLFNNESVLMPLTILSFVLILAITLIYIINKKIKFELKLNEKKQAKIIALLNKKTVVYSYYLNFLNFSYNKYGIKSSKTLKNNLEKYTNYQNTITRYDKLGKILFETQKLLEDFSQEKRININNGSIESFAKSINVDNKIAYSKAIENKKLVSQESLINIEKQQEEVWEKLIVLSENDTTKEKVIDRIINYYLNEIEKIKETNEEIENTEETQDTENLEGIENIDNN